MQFKGGIEMNLITTLYNELEKLNQEDSITHSNMITISKIYYIYKRLCEIFQYDCRWYWAIDDQQLKDTIFDEELDISNIKEPKVVCSSFSKVYAELTDILLSGDENYDITLTNGEYSHCYANTYLKDGTIIKIDPIKDANDLFSVKKGLPMKGIQIESMDEDKTLLEEYALHKINYQNQNLYSQYLQLVRDELLNSKECNPKKANELFHYFKDTSNFKDMGLKEVNDLFLLSVFRITYKDAKDLGFKRLVLYDFSKKEVKLLYRIPKSENERENYCLSQEHGKITWEKIKEPVSLYIDNYRTISGEKKVYLKK